MSDGNPAKATWQAATELLRDEGGLSDSQTAFVRMAHPLAAVDDVFMIAVGSEFVKSWIEDHVADRMTEKVSAILGHTIRLMISVDPSINDMPAQPNDEDPFAHRRTDHPHPERFAEQRTSYPDGGYADTSDGRDFQAERSDRYSDTSVSLVDPHDSFQGRSDRTAAENFDQASYGGQPQSRAPQTERHYHNEATSSPNEASYHDRDSRNTRYREALYQSGDSYHSPQDQSLLAQARLNPRYLFDNFVIGDSNRFATATSLAVAESPGTTYNPLFLYSDSGMGKTHLMHAIGNYALSLYSHSKIRYVSSEEFLNLFINSLGNGKMNEFKDQFRSVDILLIDDIQFIGGKEDTMVEFFHTFNALTNANKQIVITSDVAPNLLNGFEERMLSRFNSGVTASIDRPNLETRIAILEKKASADGIRVPREVHEYIATNMTTNIREMEGALRRVTAFADLSGQPVDLTLSEMVLKDLISNPDSIEITASLIMGQTASYFQLSIEDLTSTDRSRSLVIARQIAMYLCREMTELSLPKIGEIFGGRDHTTVMHAYRKIDKQMAQKQTTYNQVSELTSRIKQAAQQPQ
ncbi:MAG: chromosomal replication initiator protein DnaA [Ancrocorticia sp.]|uniref:chromosomal replication initiator protein DnaA n=1 Tax=Ancrocorticia sp. TaxID=2593684 RepID=UPI003F908BE3